MTFYPATVRCVPRLTPWLLAAVLAAGCASRPPPDARSHADACIRDLLALEAQAAALGIIPGHLRAVPGYPDLAVDRVLAGFDPGALTPRQRSDWLARLGDAGLRRRALLLDAIAAHKVPGSAPQASPLSPTAPAAARIEACAEGLARAREQTAADWSAEDWAALAAAARVPDEYRTLQRVLGFYPLAALPVRAGMRALHDDIAATFALPRNGIPVRGTLQRWHAGVAPAASAPALPLAARDTLGAHPGRIDASTLDALFAYHAPVLEIDMVGSFDRPGAPHFAFEGRAAVDSDDPSAFHYARVMPLAGELRLQLVYVFWFEGRPRRGAFDMLGGPVDGLVWRVTLDHDGAVLLYDSIHPCGCYHQFFPGARLALRAEAAAWPEPPLVPQIAPVPGRGERLVLRLASATHYLQRVYTERATEREVTAYALRSYDVLYAVDSPGGVRSLFAADGLVPGTQRGERFYLWPMGVPSAGAMRERGRQATAFVGRRHFDDATLLDAVFRLVPGT